MIFYFLAEVRILYCSSYPGSKVRQNIHVLQLGNCSDSHVIYRKHVTVKCNFPAAKCACFGELTAGVWWQIYNILLGNVYNRFISISYILILFTPAINVNCNCIKTSLIGVAEYSQPVKQIFKVTLQTKKNVRNICNSFRISRLIIAIF